VAENARRGRSDYEFELLDTGVFDEDRYFDLFVEYAKESPEEILIRLTAINRGPQAATLHLLPTLWFRNTWAHAPGALRPLLRRTESGGCTTIRASHRSLASDGSPVREIRAALHGERDEPRAPPGESNASPA